MIDAYVLILGAAAAQVPLIQFAKKRGYKVAVVSIPGSYPGFAIADKSIYCDVRDGDGILKAVRGLHIVAVLTDETDMSVPTVAFLTEKLHLLGNPARIAEIYSNKFLMREACRKAEVMVPNYIRIATIEDLEHASISYPAIIKPEDNQGSRGIHKVNTLQDAIVALPDALQFSKTHRAIIEDFFVGDEYVVEGYVYKGEYLNFGIGQRNYFNLPEVFIPSQTIFPAQLAPTIVDTLLAAEYRLHAFLQPTFGMIHSEYLVNHQTGEYRLVETALRGGGVYISSHLVPLYTGVNNYDMLFDCATGCKISLPTVSEQISHKAAAYICFYLPEGEVISIHGISELKALPFVHVADLDDIKVGMHTHPMLNKTMRLGPIIVSGCDRDSLLDNIACVQQVLRIKVKQGDGNIKGIEWK